MSENPEVTPGPTAVVTTPEASAAPATAPAATLPDDWPAKGYTGPQPWEVESPPQISHNFGFLMSGSAGDDVLKLAALLAYAGYPTSISRGENPQAIYGGSERDAVAAFHREYGIQEDPGVIAATVPGVVGPWTWEALHRLARRAQG